jgi:hypothetical protein
LRVVVAEEDTRKRKKGKGKGKGSKFQVVVG